MHRGYFVLRHPVDGCHVTEKNVKWFSQSRTIHSR